MSIPRVNTFGWTTNSELTSDQANELDTNITYALDKRDGYSDTLRSQVTISGNGDVYVGAGTTIDANTSTSTIKASASGAKLEASASGALITATTTGAKIITSGGATFEVGGADGVFPNFTTSRTLTKRFTFSNNLTSVNGLGTAGPISTGWKYATYGSLMAPATNATQGIIIPHGSLHDGATLSSVAIYIKVVSHSDVPAVLPAATVYRRAKTSTAVSALSNTASQSFTPSPADATAWVAGGVIQSWSFTCNQNNVIDLSTYDYILYLTDENGANAVAENIYWGADLVMSAITNMRPG
jgi:hypothetical protein